MPRLYLPVGIVISIATGFLAVPTLWLLWNPGKIPKLVAPAQPENSAKIRKQRSSAHRIRGIPKHWDRNSLSLLLADILQLEDDDQLHIKSLAVDATDERTQVATVDFSRVPPSLRKLHGQNSPGSYGQVELPLQDATGIVASLIIDTHFHGITTLHSPSCGEHAIDIIALSGLGGHAFGSFKERGGSFMWLRDSIPNDMPSTRVLIYGYDSRLHKSHDAQDLEALGKQFCLSLRAVNSRKLPNILVGHSLGGLIIKQSLVLMSSSPEASDSDFLYRTYSIVLFGVPNQGLDIDSLRAMVRNQPNESFLFSLTKNSQLLRSLGSEFKEAFSFGDSQVVCFYETVHSPTVVEVAGKWVMAGERKLLVDQASASHKRDWETDTVLYPINDTHSNMVKFCRDDTNYIRVRQILRDLVHGSSSMSARRRPSPPEESLLKELYQWLAPPDPDVNFKRALSLRQDGTGSWFVDGQSFADWLDHSNKFLWLHGIPGCGKSVLSATIIERLKERVGREGSVAYYYFDFNDRNKQDLDGMLRSLIMQIAESQDSLPKALGELFSSCKTERSKPTTLDLRETASKIFLQTRKVYIILDGMDESTDHQGLTEWLASIFKHHAHNLSIIMTSRREETLACELKHISLEIPIQNGDVDKDIHGYVDARLEIDSQLRGFPDHVKAEIASSLKDRSQGVFRWVSCQVELLRECHFEEEITEALTTLPKSLDETYTRALEKIPERYRTHAFRIFQWIICSKVPMRLDQFADMLTTEPGEGGEVDFRRRPLNIDFIAKFCGTLVTTQEASPWHYHYEALRYDEDTFEAPQKELRLAHFSVQEFLVSNRMQKINATFYIDYGMANTSIAWTSINFILYFAHHSSEALSRANMLKYPLIIYAVRFLLDHVRVAEEVPGADPISTQVVAMLDDIRIKQVIELPCFDMSKSDSVSIEFDRRSYITSSFNLVKSTSLLLQQNSTEVNLIGGRHGNVLHVAARQGNEKMVRLALLHGADIDAPGGKWGTALHNAVYWGHEGTVRLLAEHGANINAVCVEYRHRTPLLVAVCTFSRDTKEMVRLLLELGADPNFGDGRTLTNAMRRPQIAKLLIEYGADVNSSNGNPLRCAARMGLDHMGQMLIESGADINAIGGTYGTALQCAAWYRNTKMVKLLIELGADVNRVGGKFGTALQAAAFMENGKSTISSRRRHTNANAMSTPPNTFRGANSGEHHKIISVLTQLGADANEAGSRYWATFEATAHQRRAHIDTVFAKLNAHLITEKNATTTAVSGEDVAVLRAKTHEIREKLEQLPSTPMGVDKSVRADSNVGVAATYDREAIIVMLEELGINGNAGDSCIQKLRVAAHKKQSTVDCFLSQLSFHISDFIRDRSTKPESATQKLKIDLSQQLTELDAAACALDEEHGNALQAAVTYLENIKGEAIVRLLLEHGADINKTGGYYGTALQAAAYAGHEIMVSLLIEHGADINLVAGKFGTALRAAAEQRHEVICKLLVEHGAAQNTSMVRAHDDFEHFPTDAGC